MRRRLLIRVRGAASRRPLLWELGKRCGVEWNVRRVRTRADMSEAAVELSGGERDIRRAMKLLKKRGAEVFPVERSLFE